MRFYVWYYDRNEEIIKELPEEALQAILQSMMFGGAEGRVYEEGDEDEDEEGLLDEDDMDEEERALYEEDEDEDEEEEEEHLVLNK